MRYKQLGNSGLNVSVIGLGTWAMGGDWWGAIDEQDCIRAIHAAFDEGVNLVDTAPIYGKGYAEEIVGKAAKGKRDKIMIATKCGITWDENTSLDETPPKDASPKALRKEMERSLKLLQTDYVDLYQLHWPDPKTPIEETMGELVKMRKEGKLLHIGMSNIALDEIEKAMKIGDIVSIQPHYSLLHRDIEKDVAPFAQKHHMGILSYGSLGAGMLTGKYTTPPEKGGFERRENFYSFFKEPAFSEAQKLVDVLRDMAGEKNVTPGQVAINWNVQKPFVTSALVGVKNVRQIRDNAAAGSWELTEQDIARIEAKWAEIYGG